MMVFVVNPPAVCTPCMVQPCVRAVKDIVGMEPTVKEVQEAMFCKSRWVFLFLSNASVYS